MITEPSLDVFNPINYVSVGLPIVVPLINIKLN